MRIGVDASCWTNRRGYGRYTRELLSAILNLDHQNEYWLFLDAETAHESKNLPERAKRVIVQTSRAATQAASASGHRSLRDLWAMGRAVQSRGRQIDVFYFPSVYTFFPVRIRAKVIVTIHDTIAEHYPHLIFPNRLAQLRWRLKVRWAISQADFVATVSEAAKRDIVMEFGLKKETVKVVPDAVSETFHPLYNDPATSQVLAKYGVEPDKRIILYVGGISPHKNLATLLDAYRSLTQRRALNNLRLVLVGDVQGDVFYSDYVALRRKAEALGLTNQVTFTGYLSDSDLIHFYNAAQVLVMPAFDEGFGLPAVEAMACGIPVVASRTEALREVVGEAGLYFNPHVPEELTNRVQELLDDAHLRTELGQKGLARAREFSWERSARAALAAFEEVAQAS